MHRPDRGGRAHQIGRAGHLSRFLLAGIAATALTFAACGGGSDDNDLAPAETSAPAATYTAEELLPDLSDLGLTKAEVQEDPIAKAAGQDSFGAIYTGNYSVQVRVTVVGDEATARSQFDNLAVALRNPPAEFVGAGVPQADNPAVIPGGLSKGYVTSKPDGNGRLVWTDVSQFGRAIVIVQVLGKDRGDVVELRTAIQQRIEAQTK